MPTPARTAVMPTTTRSSSKVKPKVLPLKFVEIRRNLLKFIVSL
jgi:hypothetical protein